MNCINQKLISEKNKYIDEHEKIKYIYYDVRKYNNIVYENKHIKKFYELTTNLLNVIKECFFVDNIYMELDLHKRPIYFNNIAILLNIIHLIIETGNNIINQSYYVWIRFIVPIQRDLSYYENVNGKLLYSVR